MWTTLHSIPTVKSSGQHSPILLFSRIIPTLLPQRATFTLPRPQFRVRFSMIKTVRSEFKDLSWVLEPCIYKDFRLFPVSLASRIETNMAACWTQQSTSTNSQKDFDVSVETVTNLTLTSKIFHVDFKPTNGKKKCICVFYILSWCIWALATELLANSAESQSNFNHWKYDVNEL